MDGPFDGHEAVGADMERAERRTSSVRRSHAALRPADAAVVRTAPVRRLPRPAVRAARAAAPVTVRAPPGNVITSIRPRRRGISPRATLSAPADPRDLNRVLTRPWQWADQRWPRTHKDVPQTGVCGTAERRSCSSDLCKSALNADVTLGCSHELGTLSLHFCPW